jgi:hypothetical protein
MQATNNYPKIQRMAAENSASEDDMKSCLFNPEKLLSITQESNWYEKISATEKWRNNAGMSILVKVPEEMCADEVEQAFAILGTINSLKFMRTDNKEGPIYIAIEFHKWLCYENVEIECLNGCSIGCHHFVLRDKRIDCKRILEGITEQYPAYYFLPFRRYNTFLGIYETINIPCTIYIEKPEDAANTFSLTGPTITDSRAELLDLISSRIQRDIPEPPQLKRECRFNLPQSIEDRLESMELIIMNQQKQIDELKKEVDSKASVMICAVSKNMFLLQNGKQIFLKNITE